MARLLESYTESHSIIQRDSLRTIARAALRAIGSEGMLATSRRRALEHIADQPDPRLIMQVGANDGLFDDPLHDFLAEHPMPTVLIEPQREPFQRLSERYRENPDIRCVRTAIAPHLGELVLWRIATADPFGSAVARTDGHSLMQLRWRHPRRWFKPSPWYESEVVPAAPLATVCDEADVGPHEINAFFCDTEGADIDIIHQLLKTGSRPSLIQYEHLLTPNDKVKQLNTQLVEQGYHLSWSYRDVLALR